MAIQSYPNAALINYYLASYLNKTGSIDRSKRQYLRALDLLDTDSDIDQDIKVDVRKAIQDALK